MPRKTKTTTPLRLGGHIIHNTPSAIHIQRRHGVVIVPMAFVQAVEYDEESEKQ